MPVAIDRQIKVLFNGLDATRRIGSLPVMGTLSNVLVNALGRQIIRAGGVCVSIRPREAAFFASAAIEMWLRSVHSFLISASVYRISPIWASVCGYYSSHYSVRALAHLLGYFQIRRKRCVAKIEIGAGRVNYTCNFSDKAMREHIFYWKVVKESPRFSGNPFFKQLDLDPKEFTTEELIDKTLKR